MEHRQDDLGDDDLPRPGTEEPGGEGSEDGDAGSGPGNVSVDEPTAGALDEPGKPGGGEAEQDAGDAAGEQEDQSGDDDEGDTSEGTSEE